MISSIRSTALLVAVLTASLGGSSALAAAPSFTPCSGDVGFACTSLSVPLSRTGLAPGTVSLAIERLQAGFTPSHSAVLALAGGPGQAANPLADFIAKAVAPALQNRDLIVYDQRGTGRSGALHCKALDSPGSIEGSSKTLGKLGERCARELGAARGAFTSEESVADIEAIRQALGYEKLVLYGTSYGTKVAELYAERYPQNVEALVLDSVVLPEGPETFSLSTFKAIPGVLDELCSKAACSGITANPARDLARLTNQLRKHRLAGAVYDGSGHRHRASIGESELLGILQAGDLNPALRALLPAAVTSALRGEPDPLLRLNALSDGLIPNVPLPPRSGKAEQEANQQEDNALFLATSCEEKHFPWQRQASAATRMSEAQTALSGLPATDFYPFDPTTALESSLIPFCLDWQDASQPSPPLGGLPNVPTLILSGAQDLRTPTSNARQMATQVPDAQLLVVPYTGHSVLGSDFSDCAQAAVDAFFSGTVVSPCKTTKNLFSPTPVTPTSLASIKPIPGLEGKPGRTLTATLDTMLDLTRQVIGATLQADQELPSGSSFGGLHGGYARLSSSAVVLHELTFVSGVQLSAHLPIHGGEIQPATITVGGSSAARGTVTLDPNGHVSGTLGGQHFNIDTAKAHLSNAGVGSWPTRPPHFPLGPLARIR